VLETCLTRIQARNPQTLVCGMNRLEEATKNDASSIVALLGENCTIHGVEGENKLILSYGINIYYLK